MRRSETLYHRQLYQTQAFWPVRVGITHNFLDG